jgi:peptidoglycan hydrolase-like protein with peptidoglycan-binding domain
VPVPLVIRRLLPIAFALLLLAGTTPGVAAFTARFPNQSLGNRGADVAAIQGLLRVHGILVVADGVFGTATQDGVTAFQATQGLLPDGVVGDATWLQLIVPLSLKRTGEAVLVLQRQLNAKRNAGLSINGRFDTPTRNAVIAFQKHVGMTPHGKVGPVTWRNLLWHYDYPSFKSGILCDYSVGNGRANWGTGAAIGQLEAAARVFVARGHGRVSVGDVSFEHGGNIPLHQTHEVGLDVDIRPIRKADNQCTWGTNWHFTTYDRTATRQLINDIRAAAPGHVKLIYFNDPVLIREGLTTHFAGHDDHLHIRYCEHAYPLMTYRC